MIKRIRDLHLWLTKVFTTGPSQKLKMYPHFLQNPNSTYSKLFQCALTHYISLTYSLDYRYFFFTPKETWKAQNDTNSFIPMLWWVTIGLGHAYFFWRRKEERGCVDNKLVHGPKVYEDGPIEHGPVPSWSLRGSLECIHQEYDRTLPSHAPYHGGDLVGLAGCCNLQRILRNELPVDYRNKGKLVGCHGILWRKIWQTFFKC